MEATAMTTAGPSAPLRSAQDDNFCVGGGMGEQATTKTKCGSFDFATHDDAVSGFAEDDKVHEKNAPEIMKSKTPRTPDLLDVW
jgi:hypothetical protein